MKKSNLFFFPSHFKKEAVLTKSKKMQSLFDKMDPLFIEKSAQDFTNSILLGNLYKELCPKDKKNENNLTQI